MLGATVKIFFCLFLLLSINTELLLAQTKTSARVVDAKTNEALPFAHVSFKNKEGGTIANEAGYFELTVANKDSIEISYLGYFAVILPVTEMPSIIKLNPDSQLIEDVVVYADDDYLYEWLSQCRSKLKEDNKSTTAKAYLVVETICNSRPVEFMEAYYNAELKVDGIRAMTFKNGQSYLAAHNFGGYFFNFDFSHSLSLYSLLDGQGLFPENPLQFGKGKMKNKFRLERGKNIGKLTTIRFYPRHEEGELFSGEIIFDREQFALSDIWLIAPPKGQRVFKAFGDSVLDSLHYRANFHFSQRDGSSTLSHISIDYSAGMTSNHDKLDTLPREDVKLDLTSHAVMHLYDHGRQFEPPFFEYKAGISDYRLLVVPPDDEQVWSCLRNDNHIRLTPRQDTLKIWMVDHGHRFTDTFGDRKMHFESNYTPWSPTNRIKIKKMNKLVEEGGFRRFQTEEPFLTDRLKLTVQLYLDVNKKDDSLLFTTRTLLDTYQSYNYLELNDALDDYVNLYFDIGEIYRRQLQESLKNVNDIATATNLYQSTIQAMNAEHARFEKEAFGGFNAKALEGWRKRVVGLRSN